MDVEESGYIIVAVLGVVVLFAFYFLVPCAWMGWMTVGDVPLRCKDAFGL